MCDWSTKRIATTQAIIKVNAVVGEEMDFYQENSLPSSIVFVLSFVLLLDFDRCERNKPELFSKLDSKKCLRVVGQFPSLLICYNFISYQKVDIDSKD